MIDVPEENGKYPNRHGGTTMLKIGEFSKLSRVSVRMLRHYDEIGLFRPAETDRFTDYRYYREDQLPTVCRITELKDMGFSLSDIVKILEIYDDKEKLDAYFSEMQTELIRLSDETARRLQLLDTARNRLRKECNMSYNVTIKTIPERYAATVSMVIPRYEDEGMVWEVLRKETDGIVTPAEPCLCAVTFPDAEYKENDVNIEAWKTVSGEYEDTEHVKFRTLPAVTVASCTYKGSYEKMNEVYAAVIGWVDENGYECTGAMFNIYYVSPHETQNPDEFVTEVCYPVIKK